MRILTRRNRRGYFGVKTRYDIFGLPVFSIIRESNYDLIKVCNLKILKINRKESGILCSNIKSAKTNSLLAKRICCQRKKILYVITDLNTCGGVETRLERQFKYLRKNGWFPVILSMRNDFEKLQVYPNFHLNFKAYNASELFLNLIDELKPDAIEFQFKPTNFFYDIDLNALMKKCNVGCCIHEEIKIEQPLLDKLDYRIASAYRKSVTNVTYVLNWTELTQFSWTYKNQRKAILVSRLSHDKLPGILNFIKICNQYNIDFHIAGSFDDNNEIVAQLVKSCINKNAFIGYIDTIPFLKEHADEYLFVAGVGQAIMEGASLGYPALVTSLTNDYHYSSFITPDNIVCLRDTNFVIRNTNDSPPSGNLNVFFKNAYNGVIPQQFNVSQNLYELCDINTILSEYLAILNKLRINKKTAHNYTTF
ncbi:hypothetical protein KI912_001078 [Salmonella enterica]|nr:hypothetical protein [Salmonella enterica]